MAIDRDLIAKQIFNGTVTPVTGWVSPGVDGFKAGACGEACTFDAAAAKAAFDAAGGYDGTLTMTYNADTPNKAYSEAVCNPIKNNLGVDCSRCRPSTSRPSTRRSTPRSSRASSAAAGRWTTRRSRTS